MTGKYLLVLCKDLFLPAVLPWHYVQFCTVLCTVDNFLSLFRSLHCHTSHLPESNMASVILRKLRISLIQLAVSSKKEKNLAHAREMISKAAKAATASVSNVDSSAYAQPLVVLPECFNSPYGKWVNGETSFVLLLKMLKNKMDLVSCILFIIFKLFLMYVTYVI